MTSFGINGCMTTSKQKLVSHHNRSVYRLNITNYRWRIPKMGLHKWCSASIRWCSICVTSDIPQVMQEIMDMDRNIELLRKAIRDKEAYMKVAQTRLEERTKRLNVELCKDHPMKG